MKKILSVIFLSVFLVSAASAVDLWFTWTANPTNEMVTSYVIQQAVLPNTNFLDVVTAPGSTNTWPVRSVGNGSYQYRLVAVNGAGRSTPSAAVSYPTNAPSQPQNFQLTTPH